MVNRRQLARWGAAAGAIWLAGCGPAGGPPSGKPPLQAFDNGAFRVDVPKGWPVTAAGDCASLAFVAQDPQEPRRKILYFGLVGPVYQSAAQKQLDQQYMMSGGFPIEWHDMPVVAPLTPENLLANFAQIAASQAAQRFLPGCPRLEGFQAVSSQARPAALPAQGARSALVRGVFLENGGAAEGLFSLTTAPFMPMMGGPGGGTAYGYLLAGVTAPKGELDAWQPLLLESLSSFAVHSEYAEGCRRRSEETFRAVAEAGRTLNETADMLMESWQARNRSDDILAEKRSDAMLGKERLYDPGKGEVYEFDNGFYDRYRLNPGDYRNPDLQPLPEGDHGLWTAPARDGARELGL